MYAEPRIIGCLLGASARDMRLSWVQVAVQLGVQHMCKQNTGYQSFEFCIYTEVCGCESNWRRTKRFAWGAIRDELLLLVQCSKCTSSTITKCWLALPSVGLECVLG